MKKVFELSLHEINQGNGIAIVTEFNDEKDVIVPKLMIGICEGMAIGDRSIVHAFEILKSVVASVEMNMQGVEWKVTQKGFNPKKS